MRRAVGACCAIAATAAPAGPAGSLGLAILGFCVVAGWLGGQLQPQTGAPAPVPEPSPLQVEVACTPCPQASALPVPAGFNIAGLFVAALIGFVAGLCVAGGCGELWALLSVAWRQQEVLPALGVRANQRLALYGR